MVKKIPRDKFGRFSKSSDPNDFRKDPRVKRINFKCSECRKTKKIVPWQLKTTKGKKKFCSRKCFYENRKKTIPTGENSPSWKGGRHKDKAGYIQVRWREGKKVFLKLEHRIIMEKHLGRKLKDNELIHHINGIKDDNRLKNLQIVIRKLHLGEVNCPFCGEGFAVK